MLKSKRLIENFSTKALLVLMWCLWNSYGCIDKMSLPSEIHTDAEFSAGDTTYLLVNPLWNQEKGLQSPVEISISQDGLIFIADSLAKSIFVFNQGGIKQTGFETLENVYSGDKLISPIDVDIDSRMNVFFIDESEKVYRWNQLWNQKGVDSFAAGGRFLTETYEDSFIVSQSDLWLTAVNNPDWELIEIEWSTDQATIDSLIGIHCVYDGFSTDTIGDIWYSSTHSSFSAITSIKSESKNLYVTDKTYDRILALSLVRSQLIRLSSGEEIWVHDLVYDHTVSEYGTGAGTVNQPMGIDSDDNGNIYYAQWGDYFQIHKIQPIISGTYPVYPSVFQQGINDIMDLYRFEDPSDVAVDKHQYIYVANTYEREIQIFNNIGQFFKKAGIEYVTVDTTIWLYDGLDSTMTDTFMVLEKKDLLNSPSGIAVDSKGVIYVCDPSVSSIFRFRLSNQLDENLNPIK